LATGTLTPVLKPQYVDSNGAPLNGGTIDFYDAGTTTRRDTFSDVGLTTANANPVVLDSAGRPTSGAIYLTPGVSYKAVCKNSAGVTQWTQDNVGSIPAATVDLDVTGTAGEALSAGDVVYLSDGSGSKTSGRWYKADADFAYASITAGMVGMVAAAIASAASGSIRLLGRITGLSGLTAGAIYYISATAGALTSTAPSNARVVGVADGTTSLVLAPNPRPFITDGSVSSPGIAFAADADTGFYREGANRLSVATAGVKALEVDATQFIDSPTQPRCVAYHNTTQAVTADAVLSLNSEDVDVGTMHDTATNNSRITVPTGGDGFYLVTAHWVFNADNLGDCNMSIRKNGTTKLVEGKFDNNVNTEYPNTLTWMGNLVAADYVELFADKSTADSWTIGSGSAERSTRLSVVKLW
jgi:hypothetical protein